MNKLAVKRSEQLNIREIMPDQVELLVGEIEQILKEKILSNKVVF